jgi:hypothetical protein
MTEILAFAITEAEPDRADVLVNQGIPPDRALPHTIQNVYLAARGIFAETVQPAGVIAEISRPDFGTLYRGEGRNEPATPVGDICDCAECLAIYAATVGQKVSDRIQECFASRDFALGAMLDAIASAAADKLGELIERRFLRMLSDRGQTGTDTQALRYSPGYCGWHISGQKALFAFLRPDRIGISLRESFLMQPLKSVSGVVIVGPAGIHAIEDSYPFCEQCKTHGCHERTASSVRH